MGYNYQSSTDEIGATPRSMLHKREMEKFTSKCIEREAEKKFRTGKGGRQLKKPKEAREKIIHEIFALSALSFTGLSSFEKIAV